MTHVHTYRYTHTHIHTVVIPDNSSSLGVVGVSGVAVEKVGGVCRLVVLPADELDHVSV